MLKIHMSDPKFVQLYGDSTMPVSERQEKIMSKTSAIVKTDPMIQASIAE